MKKVVLFTGFIVASLTNAAIFLTTTTYIQLAIAIVTYIPLAYFALKLFPRKSRSEKTEVIQPSQSQPVQTPVNNVGVAPINHPSELSFVVPVLPAT